MLWTAAAVSTNTINRKRRRKLPQLLDRWFSRSNFPLPLSFKFTSGNERHEKAMKTFTACITPFAHRFRHLDLDLLGFVCPIPTELQLSTASQPTQTQLNRPGILWSTLQFLQLESAIIRENVNIKSDSKTPVFPFAPRLQRLRMDSLSFEGGTPLQLILPWSQLTHLILVGLLKSHLWLQLFPMCPNLQHGLFDLYEEFTLAPSTAKHVIFHHLVDLTFGFSDPINPSILGHFDFPALKTLRLQNDSDITSSDGADDVFWTATTRRRLYQQVAPLERLSLGGGWPFVCIFKAAAHIVELDLDDILNFQPYLPSLQHLPDGDSLLTNLRALSVNIGGHSELQTDVLANIVTSRRCAHLGIEKLTLYPCRDFESQKYVKKLTGQLQPLIDDGFILELRDAAMFTHWYKRLDPTATAWREGIFDIED
ncbi:uncharacterized protein LACBIDRAFT_333264 [Laccaria bicolor S238N-H82]|uniref:Predicted protein n=1 Tax=Laccaria bicolor (strain S238N-H82 / ATCC MYA-4686) TaxID=486041 RepID=B0DVE9_LACBS|nr:uncharacterized protein LACBIDRAFT_333264 [Laccaria bicolor S238N-H82]EDR01409.1 predicted protein [Laccaria bicolor S238N-H82]|eukprot:XP_001887954.1 predicted protein [Laccaria bicolor S238N-H82]